MLAVERRRHIIRRLKEDEFVIANSLSEELSISAMTVWRDLATLEQAGHLRRVRGGAVPAENEGAGEPSFSAKETMNRAAKVAIARMAARNCVKAGDIIIVEGGTTATTLLDVLEISPLTLLTNALSVLQKATQHLPEWTVLSTGGMMREASHTLVGAEAESFFSNHHADTVFVSGTGFTASSGLTDVNPLEIAVKRAMVASARRVVVLLDHTKFGVNSLSPAVAIKDIDVLITDAPPPQEMIRTLEEADVELLVANKTARQSQKR